MEAEKPWPPTLYEWAGGEEALNRLTAEFYKRVAADALLAPIFEHMSGSHPAMVAKFIGEVLGGPSDYTSERGGHPTMVRAHLEKHLTEAQRARWMHVLLETVDAVGLPTDPEFRSAFVSYIEWGSRLAVINSQPGVDDPPADAPMPSWGWGVPGGPYRP